MSRCIKHVESCRLQIVSANISYKKKNIFLLKNHPDESVISQLRRTHTIYPRPSAPKLSLMSHLRLRTCVRALFVFVRGRKTRKRVNIGWQRAPHRCSQERETKEYENTPSVLQLALKGLHRVAIKCT